MGGVYGEQLAAFPELIKPYEVFKMKPRTGGGYGPRYDLREVQAYWSQRKTGKADVEGGLRVPDHKGTFWVRDRTFFGEEIIISDKDFVEIDNAVYRIVQDDNFTHEGGFYKCLLQVMAGPTGQQHTNTKVNDAIRSDY